MAGYKYYQHGLIYSGAPHTENKLSRSECKELLQKNHNAWFIRNIYDFDCDEQTSFWFVVQDKPLTMENLHSKCRNQVRRAQKTLDLQIVERQAFLNMGGYKCYIESFKRYKVKSSVPLNEKQFTEHILKMQPSAELWAAVEKVSGKMVAYAEVLCQSNCAKYTALKGIPEYLNKCYPFYGLLFEMNRYYIEEQQFLYVTDGARSVSEHSNIQSFLDKFNFRRAYCRLNVTYVWWLRIIVAIIYPFRKILGHGKLSYLLRFEAINRNEY